MKAPKSIKLDMKLIQKILASYKRQDKRRKNMLSIEQERLEYLRGELRAERISLGELIELQGLVEHIDPEDVELLEAAGVEEYPEEEKFGADKENENA